MMEEKTTEEQNAENQKQQKELKQVYKRLFMTDDGKKVFENLQWFCGQDRPSMCEQSPNPYQTAFNEGKRRVFLRINSMIKEENND